MYRQSVNAFIPKYKTFIFPFIFMALRLVLCIAVAQELLVGKETDLVD